MRSSAEPENATLRTLLGLELVGAIDPTPSAESAPRAAGDAPLTRDQCLKQLAVSAGDDHYTVLGLGRECTARQIRDAYYGLARRYHPDRFRSGDLQDLLDRFEEFFSRVTSAYNTLGDVERRREYDTSLAARVAEGQGTRPSETAFLARQNYMRGRTLASQRRFAEALTFLENAVKLDGTQADYHRELGNLLPTP